MKVVFRSITCIRYMPTLRPPVCGSCVMTAGSVMNGAGSPGQQRWIGRRPRSTSSPRSTISWHAPLPTVFARASATDLSFRSPRTFSRSPSGGCISRTSATALRDVVELLDAEREAHPPLGAELVDQQRMLGALRLLEQQRRPAGLDGSVDDLGDLEIGIDLGRDANEFALALEQRDPLAEILHGPSLLDRARRRRRPPARACIPAHAPPRTPRREPVRGTARAASGPESSSLSAFAGPRPRLRPTASPLAPGRAAVPKAPPRRRARSGG